MIAARQIFLGRGGAKLPYDAEVEYLKSTGTQWIDTGYDVKTQKVKISARYLFTPPGNASTVWGANLPTDRNWLANQYSNKWWFGTTSGQFAGSQPSVITDVDWEIDEGNVTGNVGETTYTGTYSGSVVSGYPVYLFAVNNGGQAIRYGSSFCQLYRFKLYDNGTLVRDFIPVRFTNELGQSEGAMYDRVSGQLFRNQGTGTFLYGADKIPIETNRYVQDGLVAMWDGKENAGVGLHDANATVWKDLVGGADSTFSVSPEWGVNCLKVLAVKNVITFNSTNAVSAIGSDKFTIEIVARMDSLTGNRFTYICDATSYAKLQIFTHNYSALFTMRQFGSISSVSAYGSDVIPASGSCSTVYDESLSTYNTLFYKNGAYSIRRNNTTRISLSALYSYMQNSGPIGSYYNLRIYNRALTSAEIAANYAVDKARFNLP